MVTQKDPVSKKPKNFNELIGVRHSEINVAAFFFFQCATWTRTWTWKLLLFLFVTPLPMKGGSEGTLETLHAPSQREDDKTPSSQHAVTLEF